MMKLSLKAAMTAAALAFTLPAAATAGMTMLTASSSESDAVEFDQEALMALPQVEVLTDNDYVDGPTRFSGPLLRDVLKAHGLDAGDEIVLTALNDYAVTIPASDALDYNVILATSRDGAPMSIRDKGPIWLIYPMTDHPELREAKYNDRLIWQLAKVAVK